MRLRNVVGLCLLALAVSIPGTSHAKGFHSVYSVDGTDVWAVGDTGYVYRSVNGGTSWAYTPLWNKTLRGVAARSLNVVTVGDSGRIWRSQNSGGSWATLAIAGAPSLRAVAMPSEQVVYAVGETGLILKSLDGGGTWNPQTSGTGNTLNAVRFTDVDNGWTVGDGGTVLRTTDGGDTWLPVDVTCTTPLYGIDVNGVTVWVVGAKAVARRSTNNGASWTMMNLHTDAQPDVRAVWLKAPNTVFLAGGGGFLRRSLDGGNTWVFPKHGMQAQISSLWFAGSKAWACSNGNLSVLVSSDQDTTWAFPAGTTISRSWSQRLSFAGNVRGSTISVNPFNRDVIYCALAGTIYRSPDAGDTWTAMSTITGFSGWANNAMVVYPRDSSRITVAVSSSPKRLMMTTNAGASWFTTLNLPLGFGNYGIPLEQHPDNPDTIFFGGDSDGLYRSIDGGFSYTRLSSNTFRSPCDIVSVPDSSNIILVGDGVTSMDHGMLWKSIDGGQTFSVIDTCDAASEIPGMSNGRLRNNVAFATNWGAGGVWRSKDYGSTWQSISLIGSAWGTDVARDDPNCMIFGTYGGTLVYLSLDGGDSFINTTLSSGGVANYGFYLRDRGTLLAEESNGIWKMQVGYNYAPNSTQSVTVNAPNGGEVWEGGSTHNVTWNAQGMALARIEYRKTAADAWQLVADVPGYLGTYAWTVPEDATTDAKIRVRDAWDGLPFDETNSTFTIVLVARLAVSPDPYQFSTTLVGATAAGALYLENNGSATVHITSVTSDDSEFWPGRTSFAIPAHGNDTLGVYYSPGDVGNDAAEITVVADDGESPHTVNVTGAGSSSLDVGEGSHPVAFALWQNRPNPFDRTTAIRYALPVAAPVTLDVYNILGQRVASLVRESQAPGVYTVSFGRGARTSSGSRVGAMPAGVYFYRFQAGTFTSTRKMLLLD